MRTDMRILPSAVTFLAIFDPTAPGSDFDRAVRSDFLGQLFRGITVRILANAIFDP
jgi:hypothetical protein